MMSFPLTMFRHYTEGYTSISVREPLANILAQQPPGKPSSRNPALSRDVNDSHYATVSDDSGESLQAKGLFITLIYISLSR